MLDGFAAMDRRQLLQNALLLVGSSTVLGACASLPRTDASPTRLPLSDAQRATLFAVADTIVPVTDTPGAIAAGVPEQVETMLRDWAAPSTRAEMLGALARVEALGGGFAALPHDRRHALLAPHDAAALAIANPGGDGSGRRDEGYARLRELVITLYYYSEIALTQELEWAPIPGRWDPSVPLTPDSRTMSDGISNS